MSTENSNERLDDAFKSADLSDRVWMFFTKHVRVLASIAAIICLFFGLTLIIMVGRSICKRSMKAAYLAAIQTGNRESFAQKYISNPLGGSVFLELGDEAYQKKEYQRAMDCYHHAHVSLGNNIFGGRAAIGEGITFMKLGNYAKGEAIFAEITEEKSYPPLIRGHAMYLLANGLYERQEFSKAKGTLNQLINSNFSSQWKAAARALLQEIETVQ